MTILGRRLPIRTRLALLYTALLAAARCPDAPAGELADPARPRFVETVRRVAHRFTQGV